MKTDFRFSQSSLQDFVDCQKRFELRYIQKLKWPAQQFGDAEEYENRSELGTRFHKMVHQHNLGLPKEILQTFIDAPQLEIWWNNFLKSKLINTLPGKRNSEITLSARFGLFRLLAKYDMLIVNKDEYLILDWKTSYNLPKRHNLEKKIQTRLYPFLLVLAGEHLNNMNPPDPAQITMIYWFAQFPDKTLEFPYSKNRFEEDKIFFNQVIAEIQQAENLSFQKTIDERFCHFCNFRSYCERGTTAGYLSEDTESSDQISDFDLDLDLDLDLNIETVF